jgi:hypothetical protein
MNERRRAIFRGSWLGGALLTVLFSGSANADRLEPLHDAVFKDSLGHFTVTAPLGAMPCVRTSDYYGGRKTLMLFFGEKNPCSAAWDFQPKDPFSTSWHHELGDYTVIAIYATSIQRLGRPTDEHIEWTPEVISEMYCGWGPGRWTNRDMESPFTFGDLPGHVCRGGYHGQSFWWGTFHRPWSDPNEADRDAKGRTVAWIEYSVELYGRDKGFKRHYRTLEQVFKSITLIPASPDAGRHW